MANPRTEASKKYNKENTIQLNIKLNKKTDLDCITVLDRVGDQGQPKADYVKKLIRYDIRNRFSDIQTSVKDL